jgi:hypothetical protein
MPGSQNNTNASVSKASQPPTDVRLRFSRNKPGGISRAPTRLGEVTRQGLEGTIVRLTAKFENASVKSLAASQAPVNFFQKKELVDQSVFEGHMAKFGNSIHNYMLAGNKADEATALASAHDELDNALRVKPTPTEVDNDYTEMREQAYAAVLSRQSVFGFETDAHPDRTYFEAGKQGES